MKCSSCGNKGKPEGRVRAGKTAAFHIRGRLGTKVIATCLRCGAGLFVRMVPPGARLIDANQWSKLDAFWQIRRAEILADLQAKAQYAFNPPPEELVDESQTHFPEKTTRVQLFQEMRQAGYESAGDVSRLLRENPIEFAWLAFRTREGMVIHDGYEEFLAVGGVPQSAPARARIVGAEEALAEGELGIKAFLSQPSASLT